MEITSKEMFEYLLINTDYEHISEESLIERAIIEGFDWIESKDKWCKGFSQMTTTEMLSKVKSLGYDILIDGCYNPDVLSEIAYLEGYSWDNLNNFWHN